MRILLMLHPEFDRDRRTQVLAWVDQFASKTEQLGHTVTRFDPRVNCLTDFDWIHAFWREEAETFASIGKSGVPLSVTPSLREEPPSPSGLFLRAVRLARGLSQRRWPPVDEAYFRSLARCYFVADAGWERHLQAEWKIPPGAVRVWGADPRKAAEIFVASLTS